MFKIDRAAPRLPIAWVEPLENRVLLSTTATTTAPAPQPQVATASIGQRPSVASTSPFNGATNVSRDAFISADLQLPNSALDPTTLTGATVYLYRTADHAIVPAVVNTTGGFDAIVLQPSVLLDANTNYTFVITDNVRDQTAAALVPFTMSFTTGTSGATVDPLLAFQQVALPTTAGVPYTSVRMGPDHQVWASAFDGRILRFPINPDGTLGSPQTFSSLQAANGGPRLVTGFAFDPSSTADNPILWVSNGFLATSNAPNFSCKITRMSGPNLSVVQDMVVNLPRSINDHLTEQPVFGPDGALYWGQGAENSMGAPDPAWVRPEYELSAAILRLDVTKLTPGQPLDALTPDGGGTYNPFAAGAPLTVFASGVRNAYQLLWTQDNHLFAPVNGASLGGNTPAGPGVPAITDNPQVESDYLYNVVQGGYYGHPNPTLGHYVLDGGNPTAGPDPEEVSAYPVGTQPDPLYQQPVADIGFHRSPDGIIEYTGNAFNGALNGKIIIAEYSGGKDIAVLTRGPNGSITSIERGIAGLSGFNDPINLVEDPASGYLYVAELGGQKLTLLRPIAPHATATPSRSLIPFSSIAAGHAGAVADSETVTITDTGTLPLTFSSVRVSADAASTGDAGEFQITNALPASIAPGASATLDLVFTAAHTGISSAFLTIQSNDALTPVMNLSLRGIGTTGYYAANEPSLQALLNLYEIPDNVGDPTPNSTFFPTPPSQPNDEIYAPRFLKAGDGPVTVQPIASYEIGSPIAERVGYYTPGTPTDRTEIFHVSGATPADEQTVNVAPLGATAFDPGSSEFGLYAQFPHFIDNGHERVSYSEDRLNTWDANVMRKMRTYPLKNPDGSVVPNAYVVAFEDYNLQYDSNDIVMIIRNVRPEPAGPVLGIQNLDGLPFSDRLIFNRIQNPNPTLGDLVHDTSTVQVENTGEQPLTITGLTLSDPTDWILVNPPPLPATLAPGQTLDVSVKFIATTDPPHTDNQTNDTTPTNGISAAAAGGVYNGTLSIASNDPNLPNKNVQLAGYWQFESEHENEPGLQTITSLLAGYQVTVGPAGQPDLTEGAMPAGQEVLSGLWAAADPSQQVTVQMLDSFHNQGNTSNTFWYNQGSSSLNSLFLITPDEGQSLLPHINGTSNLAAASFSPSGVFGWNLDGENSQDSLNTTDIQMFGRSGHAVRFYPLRDRSGNVIPNSWLMAMDYQNGEFDNDDYQDLLYVVTNMRPAAAPPTPGDVFATAAAQGGVALQWAPVTYGAPVGYDIYRSLSPTGTFVKLNPVPLSGTSYTDASALPGVTMYYRVYAVDSGSGAPSVPANASAKASSLVASSGAPPAPTGLTAMVDSATSLALSWTPATGAAAYDVQRLDPGAADFHTIASAITGNSFEDTGLTAGATYVYRVRAENAAGPSPYSATATATLQPSVIPPGVMATVDFGPIVRGRRHIRHLASPADSQQFYKFTLTGLTRVAIHVGNLRDNVDLQLLNALGQVMATSSHPRRHPEAITMVLGPGTYYARVYLVGTKGTFYGLNLAFTPVHIPKARAHKPSGRQLR